MAKLTVALNLPKSIGKTIFYAKMIASRMEGNTYFPAPTVTIATLSTHIEELEAAEITTRTGVHGAAAARNAALLIVQRDLQQLRLYVETVANQHAADAPAVVASAGMSLKRSSGPQKAAFGVKQRAQTGSVRLEIRHPGGVASFDWQYSTDGTRWVDGPRTTQSGVTLADLTPGTLYWFRYRALKSEGLGDFCDPITFFVV